MITKNSETVNLAISATTGVEDTIRHVPDLPRLIVVAARRQDGWPERDSLVTWRDALFIDQRPDGRGGTDYGCVFVHCGRIVSTIDLAQDYPQVAFEIVHAIWPTDDPLADPEHLGDAMSRVIEAVA